MLKNFTVAFPAEATGYASANSSVLSNIVQTEFGVNVPAEISQFWDEQGSGYFGDRAMYFFGDGTKEQPRESLAAWNKKDFWQDVYPHPSKGGPVFFAESCFGDQLGFRWENKQCHFVLFCVDTFDAFTVAKNGVELFETVLADRLALMDEERYHRVSTHLGQLPLGMHYAPIVSPMLDGTGDVQNFCIETPNVHFRTAVAIFKSLRSRSAL